MCSLLGLMAIVWISQRSSQLQGAEKHFLAKFQADSEWVRYGSFASLEGSAVHAIVENEPAFQASLSKPEVVYGKPVLSTARDLFVGLD